MDRFDDTHSTKALTVDDLGFKVRNSRAFAEKTAGSGPFFINKDNKILIFFKSLNTSVDNQKSVGLLFLIKNNIITMLSCTTRYNDDEHRKSEEKDFNTDFYEILKGGVERLVNLMSDKEIFTINDNKDKQKYEEELEILLDKFKTQEDAKAEGTAETAGTAAVEDE